MPDYLSNDSSIAKGVERSIAKDVDTFWPVEVGVHDVVRFVSLPSKTALGPWFVGSGRSFLQTSTCKGAYRELEDLPENLWQGCAFEQPLRTDFSGFCSWAEATFFIRYEGGDLFNQHPCSSVGLDVCLLEECTLEVPMQSLVFTRDSPSMSWNPS